MKERNAKQIARDYYEASGRGNSSPTKETLARIDKQVDFGKPSRRETMAVTKEDIMLGLRVIVLEDLIRQIAPRIRHKHVFGTSPSPNCAKCQIEAVIKSSVKRAEKNRMKTTPNAVQSQNEKNTLVSGRSRPDPRGSSGNLSSERASSSVSHSVELPAVAKHTPGPWEWEYHPDFPDKVIALSAGYKDVLICSGTETAAFGIISPEHARLIAAAPELLLAAKAFIRWADSCWGVGEILTPETKAEYEAAKQAIAKAEPKRVEDGGAR